MKDNLFLCDVLSPKGKLQGKPKRLRVTGQLVPGCIISAGKDTYGSKPVRHRYLGRCLKTGILLLERVPTQKESPHRVSVRHEVHWTTAGPHGASVSGYKGTFPTYAEALAAASAENAANKDTNGNVTAFYAVTIRVDAFGNRTKCV